MKKNIFFFLFLIVCLSKAYSLDIDSIAIQKKEIKEPVPTLASVLNNYYVAIAGSKEKLEQITSLVSEGEISFSQIPDVGTVVIKYKVPNKYISTVSIMGQKVVQGFDGIKSFSNIQTMTDDKSKELQRKKGIFSELYYTNKDAVLVGKEKLDGKDVYKIVVKEDNIKIIVYFDVNSGFKVKEEIVKDSETVVKEYLDYKDFEGYKLSTKTITKVPKQIATQTIKKYEINPLLSDSEFKL